ncbi:MAG: hypothetical protein WDW38_008179 [Sanguina aurantia]
MPEVSSVAEPAYRLEWLDSTHTGSVQELIALEKKTFVKADSWADVLPLEVKKRNVQVVLAREQSTDKVVGYVLCIVSGLNTHIGKLAVSAEHRRQGIGRMLMQAVLQGTVPPSAARKSPARRPSYSSLFVAVTNTVAADLYSSLGYKQEAYLEHYYQPGSHARRLVLDVQAQ